jgi:hypothetical protein
MKLLWNFDEFGKYFDLESKIFLNFNEIKFNYGCYKIINDDFTAIYVDNNELYFSFNHNLLLLNDNTTAKILKLSNGLFKIEIFENTVKKYCFDYRVDLQYSKNEPFNNDDDDWGIFMSELINNKSRRLEFIESKIE